MTVPKVTIVDYGIGNLFSVRRALETAGAEVCFATTPAEVSAASRLVLPGVGAFADGMAGLKSRELVDPLRSYAQSGRPLLGICLGMQMLATSSEEFGQHPGLNIIPGCVVPVSTRSPNGTRLKIPHIGWSTLREPRKAAWKGSALEGMQQNAAVYLVHSFQFVPNEREFVLGVCDYGGNEVIAAVGRERIIGCQFHPEKSGPVGLGVLGRFLTL